MLSENLKRLREALKLTQEELAEKAGISFRGYQDIEYGKIESPRAKTIQLLADALGVKIGVLYGHEAETQRQPLILDSQAIKAIQEAVKESIQEAKQPSAHEDEEIALLRLFRSLTPDERATVLETVEAMARETAIDKAKVTR